ncbi:hypothetical protein B0T14DRAFT_572063 [Immersiella caudata]|uniref:Uncharacterized protein n=1 Tax=Immersiella caudata TaxID=314043 RepID=A0AA39TZ17_9PEZI|nr:hypothetical protein B0T14DRAFT_572063 [Immersiella caudata]
MKFIIILPSLILGLATLSGVQAAAMGNPNEILPRDAECSAFKRDVELDDTTAETNYTGSVLTKRQWDGTCTYGNQICQYAWTSGNFRCKSWCYCSDAAPACFTRGSPPAHPRLTPGSPPAHPRLTPGSPSYNTVKFTRLSHVTGLGSSSTTETKMRPDDSKNPRNGTSQNKPNKFSIPKRSQETGSIASVFALRLRSF